MPKAARRNLTILAGVCLLLLASAVLAPARAAQTQITAREAYRQTLTFATGSTNAQYLDECYDRLERAAYRYNIIPEFALAVVSAEAHYGSGISWARYDSWNMYELTSKRQVNPKPAVYNDLDTALSELRLIMSQSKTIEQVLQTYWCGPQGTFNVDSYKVFADAASKLWNGLEPFASQRKQAEDRSKYRPDYYNQQDQPDTPGWATIASGDLSNYQSSLKAMPTLAKQLKAFDMERDYAAAAKHYNPKLSDAEAIVIARCILTYCEQTKWFVDPRLVMAVVAAESSFKPNAVSSCGALGLGQLMPATARGMGIRDPMDPIQNLYGCVKYLERELYRWREQRTKVDLVLASYNAGAGAVQRYGGVPPYSETQAYVKRVKNYYQDLTKGKRR